MIIPNAVGVDIGCGMVFVATDIKYEDIKDIKVGSATMMQSMTGGIMRSVPMGFESHKQKQESAVLDGALDDLERYETNPELIHLIS